MLAHRTLYAVRFTGRGSASCVHVVPTVRRAFGFCGRGSVFESACGRLVTFTVCAASLSSEICLAAVWFVCVSARVCWMAITALSGTEYSTEYTNHPRVDTERIRFGQVFLSSFFFFLFSPLPPLNLQLMRSKVWWQPAMKAWKLCVVFYYLRLTNGPFYAFACVDGFQWIFIDKLDHCGRAEPLCHPLINGNQWII